MMCGYRSTMSLSILFLITIGGTAKPWREFTTLGASEDITRKSETHDLRPTERDRRTIGTHREVIGRDRQAIKRVSKLENY